MGAALSFVLLYLGTVTAVFDMSATVLCGIVTLLLAYEAGTKLCACAVAVCTVLCATMLPDKTVCVLYLTVGGVYPLFRPVAERLGGARMYLSKLLAALICIGVYVVSLYVFIPAETGRFLIPRAFTVGVVCFFLYDVLLTRFFILYVRRFSGRIMK